MDKLLTIALLVAIAWFAPVFIGAYNLAVWLQVNGLYWLESLPVFN